MLEGGKTQGEIMRKKKKSNIGLTYELLHLIWKLKIVDKQYINQFAYVECNGSEIFVEAWDEW